MIDRISTNGVNNIYNSRNQPQFKGRIYESALGAVQKCEKRPMLNVTIADLFTAIIPRALAEGSTNIFAGLEALRRESSGLLINCIIPGFVVAGIAKMIQKLVMKRETKMGGCLADGETIKLVTNHWQNAEGEGSVKVKNTLSNILKSAKGIDGEETVDFASKKMNFTNSLETYTKKAMGKEAVSDKELENAYKAIIDQTHASEHIKYGDSKEFFGKNLESVLKNATTILNELVHNPEINVADFAKRATHLVNWKSLLGMSFVIPLALVAQPINRWITAKSSGRKGAPIYKDFESSKSKELSPKEKSALFKQKLISIGSMMGVAFLSMGCKFPGVNMLQFSGLFPTMNQARIISTATFASRMAASEDKNDLAEATVRDIATFSSFYFLGDHFAKGIGILIEKYNSEKPKLINHLKKLDPKAGMFATAKHYLMDTKLKSSDEVIGKAINMRSLCQIGNLAFSLAALGLIIPHFYRGQTNKAREQELKEMGVDKKTIQKYYPQFTMNMDSKKNKTYEAFTNSKP